MLSLHQQKPTAQVHFDILQQLKSAKVHSKSSLGEVLSLPGGKGCKQSQGSEDEDGSHLVCNHCQSLEFIVQKDYFFETTVVKIRNVSQSK